MTAAPGGGIFYWTRVDTGDVDQVALIRVTEKGVQQRWTVRLGNVHVESNSNSPLITVANDDVVWVAADEHLIRLDPKTGTVDAVALPSVSDNPTSESLRPPEEHGVHNIEEVAVDTAGHVAIALSTASQVLVYDDHTRQFTHIDLPVGLEAWSVAYFTNGVLVVGSADASHNIDKVLFVRPDGTISKTLTGPDGALLIALPSGTAVLAGTIAPMIIAEDGTVRPVSLPTGAKGHIVPLRNGELAVEGLNRIVVVHKDGTEGNSYRYSTGVCGGAPSPSPSASPTGATPPLALRVPTGCPPLAFTGDGSGNLWLISLPAKPTGAQRDEVSIVKGL